MSEKQRDMNDEGEDGVGDVVKFIWQLVSVVLFSDSTMKQNKHCCLSTANHQALMWQNNKNYHGKYTACDLFGWREKQATEGLHGMAWIKLLDEGLKESLQETNTMASVQAPPIGDTEILHHTAY